MAILDAIKDPICVMDGTGIILAVNRAWREFAGHNPLITNPVHSGANYLNLLEALPGKDTAPAQEAIAGLQAVVRGQWNEFTLPYSYPSTGVPPWFELRVMRWPTGGNGSLLATHHVAVNCRRTEAALRERGAVRHKNMEGAWDTVFAVDREYRLLFNNCRHQQVLAAGGGTPPQLGQSILSPTNPPEVLAAWRAALDRAFQGEECRLETRGTDLEARFRGFDNICSPLRDAAGAIIGALVVAHETTQRTQADSTLKATEEYYRTVVEDQTEIISRFRVDGTILFVNEVYCRFFGKIRQELIGRKWQPHACDEDIPMIEAQLRTLTSANPVVMIENRVFAGNGETRWMQFVNRAFFDKQGCLAEIQSVGRDITKRRQTEEALRQSEERFRVALSAAPLAVFNQDADLRYTWVGNPTLGLTVDNVIGRTDEDLLGRETSRELTHLKRRVLETQTGERQEVMIKREGQTAWYDLTVEPLLDSAGKAVGITCAAVDITERRRLLQERSAALARLETVEEQERQRIARELHDQTAQRLVVLAVGLKNLENELAAGQAPGKQIRLLRETVDDLQRQVRHLAWDLRSREQVQGGLEKALREYVEEWSERTQVPVDYEGRGLAGEELPAQLESTLYRIAQEALNNVANHAHAHRVGVLLELDAAMLRLTVEDDGCGFDLDAIQKSPQADQRLGLLGMKERAVLVGGALLIESAPESGTAILVRIPVPEKPLPPNIS